VVCNGIPVNVSFQPIYLLFSYQTGYIMWHSRLRIYIHFGFTSGNIDHKPGIFTRTSMPRLRQKCPFPYIWHSFYIDFKISVRSYFMYEASHEGKSCTKFQNQHNFICSRLYFRILKIGKPRPERVLIFPDRQTSGSGVLILDIKT
jgi:hypothetical protein